MLELFEHLDLDVVEVSEGRDQLGRIEEEIAKHIQRSTTHGQIAYVLFASIRHNHLYTFALNADGSPITTWEEYIQCATYRFGISRAWAYNATRLYRLGLLVGFDEMELLDIDMNTLSNAAKVIKYTRRGRLPAGGEEPEFPIEIVNAEKLGIEEGWDVDEKKVKLREFIEELNDLPPDERRKYIADDILDKVRYYYILTDNFEITYSSSVDPTGRFLRDAPFEIIEHFKKRIGDLGDE